MLLLFGVQSAAAQRRVDQVPEGLAPSDWQDIRAAYEAGRHAFQPLAQQAYLKASNTGVADYFGISVSVSGDTVVVGAPLEDSSTTGVNSTPNEEAVNSGAAYVFVRSGTSWTQQAYLKASNPGENDEFGIAVSVSGDTVVIGAHNEASSTTGVNSTPNEDARNSGAAYVFVRSGTSWTQQAYLKASITEGGDGFGWSVAVSGDTVVIGARFGDINYNTNANPGTAFVFVRSGTSWEQQALLNASNAEPDDLFGWSVSVSGDTAVVGAVWEDDGGFGGVNRTPNGFCQGPFCYHYGAAYVFVRSGTLWTEQAYLTASNRGEEDEFGYSVSVSGDTVVVGAPDEDSSTTGVNSTPDLLAPRAGAAYVFVRSGTSWTQQAYLKASNTRWGDYFGSSVSTSGDTVVVGALYEGDVNGTLPESTERSGAAYVFLRSGTSWTQQEYFKASNRERDDLFGHSVSVSGDTVMVGASCEDSSTTGVNSTSNESAPCAGAAYTFVGLPIFSDGFEVGDTSAWSMTLSASD